MLADEKYISEELEKLETITKRKNRSIAHAGNPFQRRGIKNGKQTPILWPVRCAHTTTNKISKHHCPSKHVHAKILKEPTLTFDPPKPDDPLKLDKVKETLDEADCSLCTEQQDELDSDITMYELASYFENLVNIPKQMSSMAEMMYL